MASTDIQEGKPKESEEYFPFNENYYSLLQF